MHFNHGLDLYIVVFKIEKAGVPKIPAKPGLAYTRQSSRAGVKVVKVVL